MYDSLLVTKYEIVLSLILFTYLDFLGVFTVIKKLLSLLQPGLKDALLLGLRVTKPTSNLVLVPSELIE